MATPDPRVIYPNRQLQCDVFVVIVSPPPAAPDDDPIIVIGISQYAALNLAAAIWSAAYPGWTGAVEMFAAPLAEAAAVGRVMEGDRLGVGLIPAEDRYRLVNTTLVPVPEPSPLPLEALLHPRQLDQASRLAQEFVDSGAPHAKVVVRGIPRSSDSRKRQRLADRLAMQLRRAAKDLGLPVAAVMRGENAYLSRTDLEAPTAYEGGEDGNGRG